MRDRASEVFHAFVRIVGCAHEPMGVVRFYWSDTYLNALDRVQRRIFDEDLATLTEAGVSLDGAEAVIPLWVFRGLDDADRVALARFGDDAQVGKDALVLWWD